MNRRLRTVLTLLGTLGLFAGLVLATAAGSTASTSAMVAPAPTSPRLFVTSTAFTSDLGVADLSATGAPSAAPGSPHTTGSQGSSGVAVSPRGFVFVSSYSGTLRVYRIAADGALTELPGSPYSSGSATIGVAVSADGSRVFTASAGDDTISVWDVASDGSLSPVAGSPFPGPDGPVALAVATDGGHLYTAGTNDGSLWTYAVAPGGALTVTDQLAGLVRPADLALTPDGRFLYAADFLGDVTQGYALAADGTPTPLPGAATATRSASALALTPDGRSLYVGNFNGASIEGFTIGSDGSLTGTSTIATVNVTSLAVAPGGAFLYATGTGGVAAYAIAPGQLPAPVPGSPFGLGKTGNTNSLGLAITPDLSPHAVLAPVNSATPGTATRFDASASTDPDGTVARYDWDFGDGTRLADGGPTPTHVYAHAGSYPVTVTATDDHGCSATVIQTGRSAACALTSGARVVGTVRVEPGPRIVATARSRTSINARGWSRTKVTVRFTCTPAPGTTLVTPCPPPVVKHHQLHGKRISGSVTDDRGVTATASVVVRLDGYQPFVTVHGVRNGATYDHPRVVTCTAEDHFTGAVPCHVHTSSVRHADGSSTVRYRAAASDPAGNTTVRNGRYVVR